MGISCLMGLVLGFTAGLPIWAVLVDSAVYYVFIGGDSGALTAGMLAPAEPAHRGLTMVVHSARTDEHTSQLQQLMRSSYAVFSLEQHNLHLPLSIHQYTHQTPTRI